MRLWRAALAVWLCAVSVVEAAGLPPGFIRLAEVAPTIVQEMRYAGSDNFTGRPVPGYGAADCWARRETANALAKVAAAAAGKGYRLVVYDCYRPQRATDAFVRWAKDEADEIAKTRYYPSIDKRQLFVAGYIGAKSAHSTGVAVDLGLQRLEGSPVDFGSGFDLFDPRSATASPLIKGAAHANRMLLKALMEAQGFANYHREWWHYTLQGVREPQPYDVPITSVR